MIYERIRNLREDSDLIQKDIAEYLNCSQVAYSRYELGQRDIPTEVIKKLARFYNTSTDYLLNETDVKKPYPKK
jgi:transcriptional regulator with XRE-family HTH domain